VVFVVVSGCFGGGGGSGVGFVGGACGGYWWFLMVVSDGYIFSLLYDGTRVFGWLLRFFGRCVLGEGAWES